MSNEKSPMKRDGTMQVTAKEGIEYLEAVGEETLLKMQGLKESKLERTGTMAATAKEGGALLADSGINPDAQTRSQQRELDAHKDHAQKHKLARDLTMVETAKEGEEFLAGSNLDADAHTRGQQRNLDAIKDGEPAEKKARLSKEGTMVATAKEGQELLGNEAVGDTRSETRKLAANQTSPLKRDSTIDQTVAEAQHIIASVDQDAKTRSQAEIDTSGDSTKLKRDGTMQQTIQEGEEYLNRDSTHPTA